MKKLKYAFTILLSLSLVLGLGAPAFADSSTISVRFPGHMVGTGGDKAYYAVGIDSGGALYQYNSSTQKKKKIAKGKWLWLNVKGKYLYVARNKIIGSYATDFSIYRIKTNGKSKKKLADGFSPVVKGKHLYYIGVKKTNDGANNIDRKVTGLFRMNLDGTGVKKISSLKGSSYSYTVLGVAGKNLVYMKDSKWYKVKISNGKKSRFRGKVEGNLNIGWDRDYCEVVAGKNNYKKQEDSVDVCEGEECRNSVSFDGTVRKIIVSGKQMMVITEHGKNGDMEYPDKYSVFMLNRDGTDKKKVAGGMLVSGGWNY